MTLLMFDAFYKSAFRCEDLAAKFGFDGPASGWVFDDCCYVEDTQAPHTAGRERYYLLIERSEWFADELADLARILWAYHYLFETGESAPELHGADLQHFVRGWCDARSYLPQAPTGLLLHGRYTPAEARDIIDRAFARPVLPQDSMGIEIEGHESADSGPLEVRPFLTLSTSHISPETAHLLDSQPESLCGGPYGKNGWFLWCATENGGDPEIPADLWSVMQFARSKGCEHLLLDVDGNTVDGLPTWEH